MKTKHKPQRRHTRRMPSASNPVAAALARDRMRAQMRDFSIAIFMTPDGEEARELLAHLGWLLALGAEVIAQTEPEAQQTIANLAEELETSPQAWADFNKWRRGGGV